MKKALDFICIGAPKSATSTLFELIQGHPDIYIPSAKEVPFYSDDENYKKGWEWYVRTFFNDADSKQLWGTFTPQYMSGYKDISPEKICDRIYSASPNTKIIAIMREPISRCYSHFKMYNRFNHFENDFDTEVNNLLSSNIDEQRTNMTPHNTYLFASEYGRILSEYYRRFKPDNILVLFTDDLKKDPKSLLKQLFDFLEVDNSYEPANIARHSHRGGSKARIKFLTPSFLSSHPRLNFLWKKLVPIKIRKMLFMKITRWNIKPDNDKLDPQSDIFKQLAEYFAEDIKTLESLIGRKTPWSVSEPETTDSSQ